MALKYMKRHTTYYEKCKLKLQCHKFNLYFNLSNWQNSKNLNVDEVTGENGG